MKFLQKIIPIIYGLIFSVILFILFFMSDQDYIFKKSFMIKNIFILLFISIPIFLIYLFLIKFKKDISDKKYRNILITISVIVFVLQLILMLNIYFYTDWDPVIIRNIINNFIKDGYISDTYNNFYLSKYPNNLLITMLLIMLKSFPIIGSYKLILVINCLLVNLSGVFTSMTLKNLCGKRQGILCFLILIPFVLLSPWIVIPYTDTFAILFVILVLYLYTKKDRKKIDYFLIFLFSIVGSYIKPTVLIVLIAIIIVELFSRIKIIFNKKELNNFLKKNYSIFGIILISVVLSILIGNMPYVMLKFRSYQNMDSLSITHYLAMGQNDETLGMYSEKDVSESIINDKSYDINKFYKRITSRTIKEQITFFSKKTLVNFNDGSFAWGEEGSFFYKTFETNTKLSKSLKQIYYSDGKYYKYFIQFCNIIWIFLLSFLPFIIKKKNNKKELVIMLSLIGITLFLTLFEARARYLYCYSEIFIIASILGMINLKKKIEE